MATASGVKAGEAYGELTLRDRMSKKLDAAKAKFLAFSKGLAVAGGVLAGVGGAVIGALAGPVRTALELSGSIQDASDRTGVSAEELSALGYAAVQTGGSIEGLENALKGMAKLTLGVKNGTKAATGTLDQLGISSAAFLAATPTQRLGMIADGLAKIKDPGLRSALAMKALGRGGADLLPLLRNGSAGIAALTAEAERMGVVLSAEDVAAADELGDAIGGLRQQATALAFAVGAALVEPLTAVVRVLREVTAGVILFAKNNQQLVRWVAIAGLVVGGLGVVLLGVALAGYVAAGAITAFTTACAVSAAVLGFILSPLGLVIVGVVALSALVLGGIAAWFAWSESGQQAFRWLAGGFNVLLGVATTTFGAIADALMAGNWELAMQAALAGMNVLWLSFKASLVGLWQGFLGFFADSWIMLKGTVAATLAQLPALLVGPFSAMQDFIVGWANRIASALGLKVRFDGIDALRELSDGLNVEAAANVKQIVRSTSGELVQARAERQKKVDAAGMDALKASADLITIRQKAADARAAAVAKGRRRVGDPYAGGGGEQSPIVQPGGVVGTFSGAIAGMLSRSMPDLQEKIAENTERSADSLEELLDRDGLAWE